LVRIGSALRPEFAAWRYGDRFASRRRRNILVAATVGAAVVGGAIGVGAIAGTSVATQFLVRSAFDVYGRTRIVARFVREGGGPPLTLSRTDVKRSRLQRIEGPPAIWGLSVPARIGARGNWTRGGTVGEKVLLVGGDAVLALGQVLPVIAGAAGSRRQVRGAVELVEAHLTLESLIARTRLDASAKKNSLGLLGKLGTEPRLALEMLANEDAERRWLEGELKLLERQWREADRLAILADQLATPAAAGE
jgi:hypothetical protein